eukprot:7932842-Ditylum_brightwellii.AAC.1
MAIALARQQRGNRNNNRNNNGGYNSFDDEVITNHHHPRASPLENLRMTNSDPTTKVPSLKTMSSAAPIFRELKNPTAMKYPQPIRLNSTSFASSGFDQGQQQWHQQQQHLQQQQNYYSSYPP